MGEREQRKRQDPSKKRPISSREDGLPASPLHQAGWLMAEERPAGRGETCQTGHRLPLDLVGTGNFGKVGRETERPRRNIESVWGGLPGCGRDRMAGGWELDTEKVGIGDVCRDIFCRQEQQASASLPEARRPSPRLSSLENGE